MRDLSPNRRSIFEVLLFLNFDPISDVRNNYFQKFLLELSEQQCRVGAVLEEGARLVREQALTRDEANEVTNDYKQHSRQNKSTARLVPVLATESEKFATYPICGFYFIRSRRPSLRGIYR